jgi:hypothetical protein
MERPLIDEAQHEIEDSFEHAGATYRIWVHLPHDIWGRRIKGVVAATASRMTPAPAVELVNREGSPHLFLSVHTLGEACEKLENAIKAGELTEGLPHAVRPDSPGDGA